MTGMHEKSGRGVVLERSQGIDGGEQVRDRKEIPIC